MKFVTVNSMNVGSISNGSLCVYGVSMGRDEHEVPTSIFIHYYYVRHKMPAFECRITFFLLRLKIKNLLISHCVWIRSVPQQILENFPSFLNTINLSVTSWKDNPLASWMIIGFCLGCFVELLIIWEQTDWRELLFRNGKYVGGRRMSVLLLVSVEVRYSARFGCCSKYHCHTSSNKIHVLSRPNKYFVSLFETTLWVFIRWHSNEF